MFIPRGIDTVCLDHDKDWDFIPEKLTPGTLLTGGDIIGKCFENDLFNEHKIILPPKARGKLASMVEHGNYKVMDPIIELEFDGVVKKYSMAHYWPVRQARPVAEKLAGNQPLLTGQRILDALFPSVLGGTCAIPGAFGAGKTCIS